MNPWQFLWLGLQWIGVLFILTFVAGTSIGIICHLILNGYDAEKRHETP